jgi:hypothetical protein
MPHKTTPLIYYVAIRFNRFSFLETHTNQPLEILILFHSLRDIIVT